MGKAPVTVVRQPENRAHGGSADPCVVSGAGTRAELSDDFVCTGYSNSTGDLIWDYLGIARHRG